jgi:hypothetical protein
MTLIVNSFAATPAGRVRDHGRHHLRVNEIGGNPDDPYYWARLKEVTTTNRHFNIASAQM